MPLVFKTQDPLYTIMSVRSQEGNRGRESGIIAFSFSFSATESDRNLSSAFSRPTDDEETEETETASLAAALRNPAAEAVTQAGGP